MMRSLWTGASGMTSQQLNVDVISNNIANVNTTGYKGERAEFESLLYQTLDEPSVDVDSDIYQPNYMQVGHGVRPTAISRSFDQGSLQVTNRPLDFAIEGDGFFAVQKGDNVAYTKDGSFKLSVNDDNVFTLVTSTGYPVLNTDAEPIELEDSDFTVDAEGNIITNTPDGPEDTGIQMAVIQFNNPQGLIANGGNLYSESVTSGEPRMEYDDDDLERSTVVQNTLEMSNVSIADEMVKLITAQRAYELNSKSITTSDEMLQQANNLKN